jgi:transcriptional regulator with XRE-family HTH domain
MDKQTQRKKVIGACIKRKRNETGYTQAMVAEKVNLTTASYAKYETGTAVPDILKLLEIAEFFECGLDELLVSISPKPNDQAKYISSLLANLNRADRAHVVKVVETVCKIAKGKAKISTL